MTNDPAHSPTPYRRCLTLWNEDQHFDASRGQGLFLRQGWRTGAQSERRHLATGEPAHLLHRMLALKVIADSFTLFLGYRPRDTRTVTSGVGIGDDDNFRPLVLETLQPGREFVQAAPAVRREDGPARLKQLRLCEIAPVSLAIRTNQQSLGVFGHKPAHHRHALERIGILLDRG